MEFPDKFLRKKKTWLRPLQAMRQKYQKYINMLQTPNYRNSETNVLGR